MRLALVIEYDGTGYHGFQYQENAPSVQEELEAAIEQLTGARPRVKGAGRTDAGVHAAGQVAAFDTDSALPPERFVHGMNHFLPDDIAVKAAYRVAGDFDPRRQAQSRWYRYTVLNRATRSPLARRRALQVEEPLDADAMHQAAQAFVGVHDFSRFSGPLEKEEATTVRQIFAASVRRGGSALAGGGFTPTSSAPLRGRRSSPPSTGSGQALEGEEVVHFDVEGSAFLPHQVRRMAGALVDAGRGRLSAQDIVTMLEGRWEGPVAGTLPPQGLCLMEVRYADFPPARDEERKDASKALQPTGSRL
jgi:tRNA pseudouridine38-40 synthase